MRVCLIRQAAVFFGIISSSTLLVAKAARAQSGAAADTAAATFRIGGAIAKPEQLSVAALESRFREEIQTIRYESKDKTKHTSRAVPLLTIIQASKPTINPNIKHHELQFIVSVRGFDGYAVDFSLAELLPTIGKRSVWVALDQDGKPFAGEEGPVGLIAPDDIKPARWVHGVTTITVIDEAAQSALKS